jgi:hypothetical protein
MGAIEVIKIKVPVCETSMVEPKQLLDIVRVGFAVDFE